MEIEGKIIKAMELRSGTNARGNWMSQSFVLETEHKDGWKTHMVFDVFGADLLQRFAIKEGQKVNVSFYIDAHEYNGKWFNSIRARDVRQRYDEPAEGAGAQGTDASASGTGQAEGTVATEGAGAQGLDNSAAPFGEVAQNLPFG